MKPKPIKSKHCLFRCHGATPEATAQDAAELIRGYFSNWNQRVTIVTEPAPLAEWIVEGIQERAATGGDPIPWDVCIETANQHTVDVAHAAGWSYLVGKQVRAKESAAGHAPIVIEEAADEAD